MSRQPSIVSYFRSRASPSTIHNSDVKPNMDQTVVKKRCLSLIKPTTPTKSPKISDENKNVSDVINLCSDDEDIWDKTPVKREPSGILSQRSNDSEEFMSDNSTNTVIYSPGKSFGLPNSPRKNIATTAMKEPLSTHNLQRNQASSITTQATQEAIQRPIKTEPCNETPNKINQGLQTPKKSPQSGSTLNSSQASSQKSPQSREKFFSPVRKRSVVKRPANKAKRSLSTEMSRSIPSRILFEDDLFANACEGMDDKTIFLLEIINKYLNTPSLKCLLDLESQNLLSSCLQVVKPGMRLVCRLYWRKEGWYTKKEVSKICSEQSKSIDDFKAEPISEKNFQRMITSLEENGLVVPSSTQNISFDHFVSILKKEDLTDICKVLKLNCTSKQTAIEALRSFSKRSSNISNFFTGYTSSNSKRVMQMLSEKAGLCYRLSDLARSTLYKLYIIMYLGMDYNIIRENKLELTLIYDKIRRETYPLDKEMALDNASVVFKTKDDFDRYLTAHHIYEDYISSNDLNAKCDTVKQVYRLYNNISEEEMECYTSLPQWLQRYTPASIFIKILESGIQELKKEKQQGHYELALDILDLLIGQTTFRQHRKAEWYAEKALILHTCLNRYDEAAEVLLEGFKSDLSDEAKDSMRPRAKKIATQKNITLRDHLREELLEYGTKDAILEKNFGSKHIDKQPMERSSKRGKVKFETRTAEVRMVQEAEEYCIVQYIQSGEFTNGEHWEGRIVTSLFFLLFWDIIYSKPNGVRGVFLSHYQLYPLDLFTDAFYANRKQAIDVWLEVIETATEDKLLKIMHDTWSSRPEYELSAFSRGGIVWEQLKVVAQCLRPGGLAAVCRRLATNYRYTHSGFPDLTLWHNVTKQIKFVEVKTDTDKPSMKQLQWMHYLRAHNIPAEFCYVGTHTTRQRARVHALTSAPTHNKPRKRKSLNVKSESDVKAELKIES